MIRSGRLDELIELLVGDPSWRGACAAVDPDEQGFISDLDLALDALPEVPDASAIRSAVLLSSARWQTDLVRLSYGDDDLGLMVRLGLETRALNLAEEREDPDELASALASIAEAVSEVGGIPDFDAINRAEAAAESLQNPWARMRVLGRLVLARARLGDRDRAASSIEHLRALAGSTSGDEAKRGKYIVHLVEQLVSLGDNHLAKQVAELEPGDARFLSGPQASGVLARMEAAAGQLDAAIRRAAAFEHGTFDYGVMCWHLLAGAARHGTETLDKSCIVGRARRNSRQAAIRRRLDPA